MTNSTDKKHLRQLLRHQRRELPIAEKINAAEKIAQRVFSLPEFTRSQHIAFYIAHDGEVDPHLIMAYAEKNNKDAYLPALALKIHFVYNYCILTFLFNVEESCSDGVKCLRGVVISEYTS